MSSVSVKHTPNIWGCESGGVVGGSFTAGAVGRAKLAMFTKLLFCWMVVLGALWNRVYCKLAIRVL
jgi:hypothetical protein